MNDQSLIIHQFQCPYLKNQMSLQRIIRSVFWDTTKTVEVHTECRVKHHTIYILFLLTHIHTGNAHIPRHFCFSQVYALYWSICICVPRQLVLNNTSFYFPLIILYVFNFTLCNKVFSIFYILHNNMKFII